MAAIPSLAATLAFVAISTTLQRFDIAYWAKDKWGKDGVALLQKVCDAKGIDLRVAKAHSLPHGPFEFQEINNNPYWKAFGDH